MLQQTNEAYLPGWTAYIDANNNAKLDSGELTATTDSTGYFAFQSLAAGTYRVREVMQSGWQMTRPAAGFYDVSVSGGQTVLDRIFGNRQTPITTNGSIGGAIFNDLNADGQRQSNELGLSGWQVYLDANNNASPDPGESVATTDAAGNYSFANLPAGPYHVRSFSSRDMPPPRPRRVFTI